MLFSIIDLLDTHQRKRRHHRIHTFTETLEVDAGARSGVEGKGRVSR